MNIAEESLCARCARHTTTCCQWTEIYATTGDVDRIARHTGRSDFHEFRPAGNPAYADQNDDPLWRDHAFRPDGTRRVLKRQPNGDCTFLGPSGCTLPSTVRPLICRLYPFDYTADGLREELAPGCPLELLAPGQHLLDALNMRREAAVAWHRQLYDEIREEARMRDPLPLAADASISSPPREAQSAL